MEERIIENTTSVNGELSYDDKVIEKIVGIALESIDGLLGVDAGFFSNIKDKIMNSSDVTQGIDVEVGKTQVAVNLNIIVEYGKHLPTIFEDIKEVIQKEVLRMTELELIEVNVKVVDIKTKKQYEIDSISLQDRITGVANKEN